MKRKRPSRAELVRRRKIAAGVARYWRKVKRLRGKARRETGRPISLHEARTRYRIAAGRPEKAKPRPRKRERRPALLWQGTEFPFTAGQEAAAAAQERPSFGTGVWNVVISYQAVTLQPGEEGPTRTAKVIHLPVTLLGRKRNQAADAAAIESAIFALMRSIYGSGEAVEIEEVAIDPA